MDYLRKIFNNGNKKNLINLGLAFCVGIILLISSETLFKNDAQDNSSGIFEEDVVITSKITQEKSFAEELETRLEQSLAAVYGVGNVKVMLTLSYGREIVLASNTVYDESNSKEVDSEGGTRETSHLSIDEQKILIKDNNNIDKPLILKEIEPKVEGVIIIAQGGGDARIQELLVRAAQTVLGIDAHKVQVLRMK